MKISFKEIIVFFKGRMNKIVALQDLGLKDYKEAWDYQEVSILTMTEKTFPQP